MKVWWVKLTALDMTPMGWRGHKTSTQTNINKLTIYKKHALQTCYKCAWGKFCQLLPLLTNCNLPLLTRGRVYSSWVRSVMLHAAETWAMTVATLNRLRHNDRAMIRWICNVKAKDEVSSDSLLSKLGI